MKGFDELWRGGPRIKQDEGSFKLSTDSVLLGDFAGLKQKSRCLDLGCGAGVLCVILAAKHTDAKIAGMEIQPEFAGLACENVIENGFDDRVDILTADIREHRSLVTAGSFDYVVSNPPYFAQNSGFSAPEAQRAASREERFCTVTDICAAAKWALRWGGGFAVVHRPERLAELICAMSGAQIEPKRLRLVHHSALRAPSLVLVEGRRGAAPGLVIEPPLVLTEPDGSDSDEAQKIYKMGAYGSSCGGEDL